MIPLPSEHDEQVAFRTEFMLRYPGVVIIAIANGGSRHTVEAVRLKQEGVTPGVPDMYIPAYGLWVEMKRKGGRLSPVQTEMISYLRSIGDTVVVGYGAEDAIRQVSEHIDIMRMR